MRNSTPIITEKTHFICVLKQSTKINIASY